MAEANASLKEVRLVPVEDCRAQLSRILASSDFSATARERRFLEYVVDETLAGHADRIKAYSIAIEVFGRDASFDAQNDPIVRVGAGRLRRSLERYFLTGGRSDPILIDIPKGGYAPVFSFRSAADETRPATLMASLEPSEAVPRTPPWRNPLWWSAAVACAALLIVLTVRAFQPASMLLDASTPEVPRILVARFDSLSGNEESTAIASGLTQEVIGQLSKFREIVVVEGAGATRATGSPPPRYALSGSVALSEKTFHLRVRLVNQADGAVLWANSYDGNKSVATLVEAQADIAENVSTSLAQSYGIIFRADAQLEMRDAPDDWAAYSCTLAYYAYRATLDQATLPAVRDCLEGAVQRFPDYATAWGLLAQVYIDQMRFKFPFDVVSSGPAIERALTTARRAVELDPQNLRGLQAEMFALFFSKEPIAARSVGERALALNPNDTELMGEYGYRLALTGSWDEGCPLVAKARERNPGPLAYYETALALCAYFGGDHQRSVMWIKRTTVPRNSLYHVIAAAIFAEAGMVADADRERAWLEQNEPNLLGNLRQEVSVRLSRAEDAEMFLNSLRKAGFDVSS